MTAADRWPLILSARAAGQPATALVALGALLADEPDHWPARLLRVQLYTELGRYADAHAELASLLDDPRAAQPRAHHLALLAIGELYERTGEVEAALKTYAALRAHAPDHTDGYVHAGAVLARRGRLDEAAAQHAAGAACADGRPEEALHNLGLVRRAQGELAAARVAFTAALARDPGYAAAQAGLADVAAAEALTATLASTPAAVTPRDT